MLTLKYYVSIIFTENEGFNFDSQFYLLPLTQSKVVFLKKKKSHHSSELS